MSYYIVCHKKRNNPRMDVRICREKCNLKENCREYISYLKVLVQNKNASLSAESHSLGLGVN
jgi:hypothetical protein